MIEFAIILPVLLLILLGIIDLGRLFYSYEAVANAAREGARYCALHRGDTAGTQARIIAEIGGRVPLDLSQTVCQPAMGGEQITVTVHSPFALFTPILNNAVNNPIDLAASASMVVW